MSRIKIQNFGPIELFEHDIDKNFTVIIGEQASGKSMIAKIIFFCRSISEEFEYYLMNSEKPLLEFTKEPDALMGFIVQLRVKFMKYFDAVKNMESFFVEYTFDNDEKINIQLKEEYVDINFSNNLKIGCIALINKIKEYDTMQKDTKSMQTMDFFVWINQNQKIIEMIRLEINGLFRQPEEQIFIPAGRSILTSNPGIFRHSIWFWEGDILMDRFVDKVTLLKRQYTQGLEDIVKDKTKLTTEKIDFEYTNKAIKLVRRILKGEYRNEKGGEKIYYAENQFVKLAEASSGQQEALWIAMLIFSIILNHQKVYLVIEEPEAHLFPNAQKDMLELIALMINATGSSVVLTTHSPYILTAANLLIYSAHVEKENKENEIVPKEYRLSLDEVAAYLLREHRAEDIMDRENYMIDAGRIDAVSEDLNTATDKLVEMEMKNEL